jgi:hypothetical protein
MLALVARKLGALKHGLNKHRQLCSSPAFLINACLDTDMPLGLSVPKTVRPSAFVPGHKLWVKIRKQNCTRPRTAICVLDCACKDLAC